MSVGLGAVHKLYRLQIQKRIVSAETIWEITVPKQSIRISTNVLNFYLPKSCFRILIQFLVKRFKSSDLFVFSTLPYILQL